MVSSSNHASLASSAFPLFCYMKRNLFLKLATTIGAR